MVFLVRNTDRYIWAVNLNANDCCRGITTPSCGTTATDRMYGEKYIHTVCAMHGWMSSTVSLRRSAAREDIDF